jgi:hypothetical protein
LWPQLGQVDWPAGSWLPQKVQKRAAGGADASGGGAGVMKPTELVGGSGWGAGGGW